ncbi:hypothetical protein Ndes2526B_g09176 [Nannochloris sp. 'desiccata']
MNASYEQAGVGHLGPVDKGKRAHFCASCNFPAAKHARCAPCLHVFCMSCAANMGRCVVCSALITKIEPIPAGSTLFVSPATLQGYRTEADLQKHVQHLNELAQKR